MLYNVVLYSKILKQNISKLVGYDGRPLKFTEFRHALAAANDQNLLSENEDKIFIVVEEKNV